jgi:ABC-type glycerol-3-phosphate transport system substrate-binding protein
MPKNRFSTLIWIILYLLVILTACGRETSPEPEDSTQPAAVSASPRATRTPTPSLAPEPTRTAAPLNASPNDLRGLDLQFWHPWIGGAQETALLSLVDQFNETNSWGFAVTAFSHGDDLDPAIRAAVSSGGLPDVTVGTVHQLQSWQNYGGFIVDQFDYVYDLKWGLGAADQSDFYPVFWEQDVVNGARLGLPFYRSAAMLFYNQTWAEELGFDFPPATSAEFKEQACAAAANNNDGSGGWIASSDPAAVMGWLMAFGEDGVTEAGHGYSFNSSKSLDAFDFIKGVFKAGCAWVPDNPYPGQEFAARRGLFLSSSIAALPFQVSLFTEAANNDQWIVLPFPAPEGDPAIDVYGASFAILKSSPKRQLAAWLFINWMTQPKNQAQFVQAGSYFPARASALEFLGDYAADHPQWAAALDVIPYGKVEPNFGSWGVARWALSDAVDQLIDPDFPSEDIPFLLEELDALLAETHIQNR